MWNPTSRVVGTDSRPYGTPIEGGQREQQTVPRAVLHHETGVPAINSSRAAAVLAVAPRLVSTTARPAAAADPGSTRVVQPGVHGSGETVEIVDDDRGAGGRHLVVDLDEVVDVRAGEDGHPPHRGLQGVVAAGGYQRTADEGHRADR